MQPTSDEAKTQGFFECDVCRDRTFNLILPQGTWVTQVEPQEEQGVAVQVTEDDKRAAEEWSDGRKHDWHSCNGISLHPIREKAFIAGAAWQRDRQAELLRVAESALEFYTSEHNLIATTVGEASITGNYAPHAYGTRARKALAKLREKP